MPAWPPRDPITALNKILSEVVDLALTVQPTQDTAREGHELRDRLNTELHVHLDALETGQAVSTKAAAAG